MCTVRNEVKKEGDTMKREMDPAAEGMAAARRDNAAPIKSAQIVGRRITFRGKAAKVVQGAYGFVNGPTAYWVRLLEACGKYGDAGDEVIVTRRTITAQLGI